MGKKEVKPVLCDSNILFNFLKGDTLIQAALEKLGNEKVAFPVIVHAEAYAGSGKLDFVLFKELFSRYKVYHFTKESSHIFNGLIQSYHTRHSKWIPDAIIASIAIENNLELYTLNKKDFDFIKGLKLYRP